MAKAFHTRRSKEFVWLTLPDGHTKNGVPASLLTSAQCRALAFNLLRHSTNIERDETDRLQGSLPLLYERI